MLWYGPVQRRARLLFQLQLGQNGDVPIPGYYDNDLKEDPAIYRPPAGSAPSLWFALKSSGGTSRIDGLGVAGDVAVQKRPALAGGS